VLLHLLEEPLLSLKSAQYAAVMSAGQSTTTLLSLISQARCMLRWFAMQTNLFDAPFPEGLSYVPDFIEPAEQTHLVKTFRALPLLEARYKEYTARRRTVSFGAHYDFTTNRLTESDPVPEFLLPLRQKVSNWLAVPADRFAHALVTEYRPGTALGWHRDVPEFDIVVGVSLGAPCRMRFRPYPPPRGKAGPHFDFDLEPRSAYLISGVARWRWQHSVPAVGALRYSVTFRTFVRRPRPSGKA